MIIVYTLLEFLCGSFMFSYWLGRINKIDLTKTNDGNPGAFNLWHTAGYKIGIAGVFLDFIKGYFPLIILVNSGKINGLEIIPVAAAPILGHAFSPFLNFNGGKTIAVSFGVWSAVTDFRVSLAYAIILALLLLAAKIINHGKPTSSETDAFMSVLGMFILLFYILFMHFNHYFIILWFANFLVLFYKNKDKLHRFFINNINKTISM